MTTLGWLQSHSRKSIIQNFKRNLVDYQILLVLDSRRRGSATSVRSGVSWSITEAQGRVDDFLILGSKF